MLHLMFSVFCFSAGQQQLFQQVAPSTVNSVIPGVVHRPQVQQITKNVVTLSNVQSPVVFSTHSNLTQPNCSNSQSLQTISVPALNNSNSKGIIHYYPICDQPHPALTNVSLPHAADQIVVKRVLPPPGQNNNTKKIKLDLGENSHDWTFVFLIFFGFLLYLHNWNLCHLNLYLFFLLLLGFFLGSTVVKALVENGSLRKKCPRCQESIAQEQFKRHMTVKKTWILMKACKLTKEKKNIVILKNIKKGRRFPI